MAKMPDLPEGLRLAGHLGHNQNDAGSRPETEARRHDHPPPSNIDWIDRWVTRIEWLDDPEDPEDPESPTRACMPDMQLDRLTFAPTPQMRDALDSLAEDHPGHVGTIREYLADARSQFQAWKENGPAEWPRAEDIYETPQAWQEVYAAVSDLRSKLKRFVRHVRTTTPPTTAEITQMARTVERVCTWCEAIESPPPTTGALIRSLISHPEESVLHRLHMQNLEGGKAKDRIGQPARRLLGLLGNLSAHLEGAKSTRDKREIAGEIRRVLEILQADLSVRHDGGESPRANQIQTTATEEEPIRRHALLLRKIKGRQKARLCCSVLWAADEPELELMRSVHGGRDSFADCGMPNRDDRVVFYDTISFGTKSSFVGISARVAFTTEQPAERRTELRATFDQAGQEFSEVLTGELREVAAHLGWKEPQSHSQLLRWVLLTCAVHAEASPQVHWDFCRSSSVWEGWNRWPDLPHAELEREWPAGFDDDKVWLVRCRFDDFLQASIDACDRLCELALDANTTPEGPPSSSRVQANVQHSADSPFKPTKGYRKLFNHLMKFLNTPTGRAILGDDDPVGLIVKEIKKSRHKAPKRPRPWVRRWFDRKPWCDGGYGENKGNG